MVFHVSRKFEECFLGVSLEFQGYLRKFLECFKGGGKEVSKVIQVSFKVVSGMLQGCVKKVLREVPENFIVISQCFRVV